MTSRADRAARRFGLFMFVSMMLVVGCADRHREFPSGPIDPWQPRGRDRSDSESPVDASTHHPPPPEPDRCAPPNDGGTMSEGTLKVSFTTVPAGGLYVPRNCGAVWIEDDSLAYVRTLELWASKQQLSSVVQWNTRACYAGVDAGVPDAVASATLPEHKTHEVEWDGTDFRGNLVPDGEYTLWIQVTENQIFPEGPFVQVPFRKGQAGQVTTLPAAPGFKDIKLEYVPAAVERDQ